MPTKYPFCRRKYTRAGAYEKHLRTAQAKLDIVLTSTIRNTSRTNSLINRVTCLPGLEVNRHPWSDYEADLNLPSYECDEFWDAIAYESGAEASNDASFPAAQTHRLSHSRGDNWRRQWISARTQ